ncbi:hypothetical protein SLEP1_g52723 [Rubroshorea leprosula]|uniref:Uncharacterized protein n=1 Tax=Rubroshorea leprosula TaxID=152421 RepID=A0AAV5M7B6_9ROSI|nr:hypothetical protein SLEP1_g52723 [Rubroshorea leprosula]
MAMPCDIWQRMAHFRPAMEGAKGVFCVELGYSDLISQTISLNFFLVFSFSLFLYSCACLNPLLLPLPRSSSLILDSLKRESYTTISHDYRKETSSPLFFLTSIKSRSQLTSMGT